MPGFVAVLPNPVMCSHGGQAKPAPTPVRVFVMGAPVVPISTTYAIAGCSLAAAGSLPCATGAFSTGATRVFVSAAGVLSPVGVAPNMGLCVPTGQPLIAAPAGQSRVVAT